MKKQAIIIIGLVVFIIFFSGCTNNEQTGTETKQDKPLFIILRGGVTNNDQSVYVDIQNIDTKTITCNVIFILEYVNENSLGEGDHGGGTTEPTGPSGVYSETHTITRDIYPHETERITCFIHEYTGYVFSSWDYNIRAEYR